MKEIILTQGKIAFVNDLDAKWIEIDGNWCAHLMNARTNLWYAVRKNNKSGRWESMHRVIMALALPFGIPPGMVIDHKDENGLNNRRRNLKPVPGIENTRLYHQRRIVI